jgi:hypothetical protein
MTKTQPKGTERRPSKRGTHGYTVPEAGAMIGLSRGASYEAAKNKQIPTIEFGSLKIVPRAPWHRILGLDD